MGVRVTLWVCIGVRVCANVRSAAMCMHACVWTHALGSGPGGLRTRVGAVVGVGAGVDGSATDTADAPATTSVRLADTCTPASCRVGVSALRRSTLSAEPLRASGCGAATTVLTDMLLSSSARPGLPARSGSVLRSPPHRTSP
jgi:hypothetical protein